MLQIVELSKKFVNGAPVLKDISLTVHPGEYLCLLGPSGCGKTTLLRILAGLDYPSAGSILFDGAEITDWTAQRRPFNLVFQKYALFPHLTIFENVAFGLRLEKVPKDELNERVFVALELVRLAGFENRLITSISGGQAQRVALARALVKRPKILLLDEPLSALDMKLREEMQEELTRLQKELGIAFIHVTHDQQEAFALSDRVAVMNEGVIEQISEPAHLYDQPETLFAAQFVGDMAMLPIHSVQSRSPEGMEFQFENFNLRGRMAHHYQGDDDLVALVRPEKLRVSSEDCSELMNRLNGHIVKTQFRGPYSEIEVMMENGTKIQVLVESDELRRRKLNCGSAIDLAFHPEDTLVFPRQGLRT